MVAVEAVDAVATGSNAGTWTGLRPVPARTGPRRPGPGRDGHLVTAGCPVGARRHDPLGLPGDTTRARAQGDTPVAAVSTRPVISLVVLVHAS